MRRMLERCKSFLSIVWKNVRPRLLTLAETCIKKVVNSQLWKKVLKRMDLETNTVAGKGKAFLYLSSLGFLFISGTMLISMFASVSLGVFWLFDILILVALGVSFYLGYQDFLRTNEPLQKLITVSENIAKGDLTQRTGIIQSDEIGMVAKAFDEMIHSIEEIINNVQYSSERTINGTKKLDKISKQVKLSSEQIVETMNTIARGAEYQSSINETIRDNVVKLRELSNQLEQKQGEIEEKAQTTTNTIMTSQDELGRLIENVELLSQATHDTNDKVQLFRNMIEKISFIAEQTNNIAQKTSLLSINASIEAANAGIYGRGFSVVAQEVKSLSNQSFVASKEIENIINSIRTNMSEVSKQTETSKIYAVEGTNSAETAAAAMMLIVAEMENVMKEVEEMKRLMEQQRESVTRIEKQTKESSEIAVDASASTEEVYATSIEFVEQMKKISSMTKKLAEISDDLREGTKKFKVENVGFYL